MKNAEKLSNLESESDISPHFFIFSFQIEVKSFNRITSHRASVRLLYIFNHKFQGKKKLFFHLTIFFDSVLLKRFGLLKIQFRFMFDLQIKFEILFWYNYKRRIRTILFGLFQDKSWILSPRIRELCIEITPQKI